jgi:large subunit ribosomal protein L7/L12
MAEETKQEEIKIEAPKEEPKAEEPKKAAPSGKFKEIIKQIEELKVADLAELVKELEDRFGVSAAMAAPVAASASAEATADKEEKSSFTVVLTDSGAQKIAVIKAVREIRSDLGLKEAKDLVDAPPKELVKEAKKDAADEAKKKIEAAGGKVELK